MINAILIFNNQGKPRLVQFYKNSMKTNKQEILQETFAIINKRQINGSRRETERTFCSFIFGGWGKELSSVYMTLGSFVRSLPHLLFPSTMDY